MKSPIERTQAKSIDTLPLRGEGNQTIHQSETTTTKQIRLEPPSTGYINNYTLANGERVYPKPVEARLHRWVEL